MRASTIPVLKGLLALLALLFAMPAWAQLPVPAQGNHMAAELVADGPARPGETLTLALRFTPQPGWHGYWANPGDAGYGMRLAWNLPEGWTAGEPLYPVPQRLLIAGLMNHVYEGDYAVLVPIEVPASAAVGNIAPIEVKGDWLVCTDEICVPEGATLTLRVLTGAEGPRDPRFDTWRAALPPPLDSPARFELTQDRLRIAVPLPASLELADPHVFLRNEQLVDYAAVQTFTREGDLLIAEIPRKGLATGAENVSGILKLDAAGTGITFAAGPGPVPRGGAPLGNSAPELAALPLLLGAAFLGGLLLNLMPCVFPILSLKALTLARAGESEAGARREALAYTAGVLLACVALGALLLVLRSAGSEIGWAFQLQEPGVVVALLVLSVAITANLAGLYELPSLSITRSGGRMSAFATGLLAAFVATPCTGPFMAAALGAALLLPWAQALLLFAMLGLGLALPFLALGFVPALRRVLPKPGRWMETFRRVLAVPMGLTALALLWLAWRLGGPWFAALALSLAVMLVAVLFLLSSRSWNTRLPRLVYVGFGAVALVALVPALTRAYEPGSAGGEESILAVQPFSEAQLASARGTGKPVFLWFTADWCLTCKVNESVAIEREGTREAFEAAGVVAMRGDWTRRDPAITRFLTAHGAAGVPLYLWYKPGGEAEVLPQVLTPDTLSELAGTS
jgi:DsbC/DsbD-like thiol-disulfide interchange protein/cytochrome c biogenesis protein CcdA